MRIFSRHLGLPARLTLLVTAVFALTVGAITLVLLEVVEDRLLASTRHNTEAALSDYLDRLYRGEATIGGIDRNEATGIFYLDEEGQPLTEAEFFARLAAPDLVVDYDAAAAPTDLETTVPHDRTIRADPFSGRVLDVEHVEELRSHEVFPVAVGQPRPVELGADVVAVAQDIEIGDQTARVGATSPLRPVQESLATLRAALWLVVPLLVAAVAALSWLTTTRALRPVDAITQHVRAISHANLSERVPVPASADEIKRLAVTMNDMLERLDQSHRRQRQFVADASHELRSPIAVTRAQLEVARAHPQATDWPATADIIMAEQEHLTQLVDDLLALSRMDEDGVGKMVDVDLDELVMSEARRPRDVAVGVTAPQPARIRGQPQQLTRALRNLVDNAAAHAVDGVHLSLHTRQQDAVITVDDDGPGIHPDDRERVFERFTRLDEARNRQHGGTGLGLAIARQVVRAHHGDLSVGDSPQGGARFILVLPLDCSAGGAAGG